MFQLSHHGRIPVWLVAILALATLAACTLADEPVPAGPIQTGAPTPQSLPDAGRGAEIYFARCAACHGQTGKGDGPSAAALVQQGAQLPDFTDPAFARTHSATQLYGIITDGNIDRFMPPWGGALTDAERWDAAYFLYSFGVDRSVFEKGQAVYTALCAGCHASDGSQNGLADLGAMSALSPEDIVSRYVIGDDGIHALGAALDEDSRWAVAFYARTFAYDPAIEKTAALFTQTPTPDHAPAVAGLVSGRVENRTPGGASPAGLTITLKGLAADDTGEVSQFVGREAQIGADGSYRFDGLPFDRPQSGYLVSVVYNGVEFTNGGLADSASPSLDLPVIIYEMTTDPSVISLDVLNVVIRQRPGSLEVVELMVYSNLSDRVFVSAEPVSGGKRGSVSFQLPPDAYGLVFQQGKLGIRFIQHGETITDTQQVFPGSRSHTIGLSYVVPFTDSRDFALPIPYPTGQVNVLAEQGLDLHSTPLSDGGSQAVQGIVYTYHTAQSLPSGAVLTFSIQTPMDAAGWLRLGLSVLLGILVITSLIGLYARRQYGAGRVLPERISGVRLAGDTDALVRQIAALDDTYAAGKINRFEYEARRADLKADVAERLDSDN